MPTNHISNSLTALLAVFYVRHAEENSSKVSHLFPGGNGDTPFDTGIFRTGHGVGDKLAILQRITTYPCCILQQGYVVSFFVSGIWLPIILEADTVWCDYVVKVKVKGEGSRNFECSPSVVFSAGGEQDDFV